MKNLKSIKEHFGNTDIIRSESEINELLDKVSEGRNHGSKFAGMSYEDGIQAMYDWLVGNVDENPMED
jgi:hypothetical protein